SELPKNCSVLTPPMPSMALTKLSKLKLSDQMAALPTISLLGLNEDDTIHTAGYITTTISARVTPWNRRVFRLLPRMVRLFGSRAGGSAGAAPVAGGVLRAVDVIFHLRCSGPSCWR